MKVIKLLIVFFQILSVSASAHVVEYVDGRWYETQEEAEAVAARDEVNGIEIYNKEDYPNIYKKIEETLDQVYEKAKKSLSPYYSNFPEKPVFILTDMDGSLPMRINGASRTTNILYVRKGTVEGDALRGVLAHEISHYILDHGREGQQDPIEEVKHISTAPNIDSIICSTLTGYETEIEPDLKDLVDFMLSAPTLFEEDTQSVPFDIQYDTPLIERIMTRSIIGKYNEKESCKKAGDLRDTIAVDIYVKYCSFKGLQGCRIPRELKDKLPQMISEFKNQARTCLEGEEEHFYSTFKELAGEEFFQITRDAFDDNNYSIFPKPERPKAQIELLFSNRNPMDRIFEIHKFGKEWLENRLVELDINKKDLRLFTSEDEADILAQVILFQEGNSENFYAISRLQYMSNEEKNYCESKVANGEMPNYGFLNQIHKSQCWRYWRSIKLKEELKNPSMKSLLVRTILQDNLKSANEISVIH